MPLPGATVPTLGYSVVASMPIHPQLTPQVAPRWPPKGPCCPTCTATVTRASATSTPPLHVESSRQQPAASIHSINPWTTRHGLSAGWRTGKLLLPLFQPFPAKKKAIDTDADTDSRPWTAHSRRRRRRRRRWRPRPREIDPSRMTISAEPPRVSSSSASTSTS